MSPRAAWRLESLGFTAVYEYTAGKEDWFAHGLPREGQTAAVPYAGDLLDGDVVTCGLEDSLPAVAERVANSAHTFALVVNEERIVLGRVPATALERPDSEVRAEEAMDPGPATIRPNQPADALAAWMGERGLHTMVVTAPGGRLLGLFRREDGERAAAAGESAAPGRRR